MTNYQSFLKRLDKCKTRAEAENLMSKMCYLHQLGLLSNNELVRMDTRSVERIIKEF